MNRLKTEKSPYLLQHAGNPVDWYPWSEEAFEKARKENRPVFLSIGYATCHWCHVMEHESFEDEEVALRMNRAFVNIKVDREERPDIDHTYMTVCQMLTGHGGWPLTIIMTPEKEPFFAATYLPKQSRPGRIGMLDLIPQIEQIWNREPDRILRSTEKIKQGFIKTLDLGKSTGPISETILEECRNALSHHFDPVHGGFGDAPKFPSPHNLLFLIDDYRINGNTDSLHMVLHTLEKMRLGGVWDHVGKGFHRYSTDREWLLPHFEKMLYDQAMLLLAYAEGWVSTGADLFKQTAFDIVDYLDECLTSPEGTFYSAEDADSEGEEGKFYVWSREELEAILQPEEAALFCDLYQIRPEGNFLDEATRQKTGANIPHLKEPFVKQARKIGASVDDLLKTADNILLKLHTERKKRLRPLLDDKILTDWNGLMITALARAGVIFDTPGLILRAERAWTVLEQKSLQKNRRLLHRLKDDEAAIDGMADDYAFIIWGLLELYDATFKPRYLAKALELQKLFDLDFLDQEHGGCYFTGRHADPLLGRQKEIYDGAVPSSNSVAIFNGFRLSRLTGEPIWEDQARKAFRAFSEQLDASPAGYTFALKTWRLMHTETVEIVITSPVWNSRVEEIVQTCREVAPAGSSLLLKTEEFHADLEHIVPFVKNYPVQDQPAIYVCKNFECKTPVYSSRELVEMLTS